MAAPPAVPVSAVVAIVAPAGVAASLAAGQSFRSTCTARSASSTHPRATTWVAPTGVNSRRTTQRSGRGGSESRLLSVPAASCPRRSASGTAQCRWTPGGRFDPPSNAAGNPAP